MNLVPNYFTKNFFSDYCRGDVAQHSKEFTDYVKSRDYDLHTVSGYGDILERCGFKNVRKNIRL